MDADPPGRLDDAARALYVWILQHGGRIEVSEVSDENADALRRLAGLGLVINPIQDTAFTVVSPQAVAEQLSAQLRADSVRLLARADEVSSALGELTRAYEAAPLPGEPSGGIERVRTLDTIRQRIAQLGQSCRFEILAAQPGGARPEDGLPAALEHSRKSLARGCSERVLYQPDARADRATSTYAAAITELGAKVRVLDEPFERMLIFDRKVAVIPASATDRLNAAVVEDPAMVEVLVEIFERDWERADRVRWDAVPPDAANPVGLLLAQGLTQRAIATRLGLSERTVAAQIARLREEYEAETLFQLGWQMRATAEVADGV